MTAYNVYRDDGQGVNFRLIYSGTCTKLTINEDINPGVLYSFYVSATNFNGEGQASDVTTLRACVAPSAVQAPTLMSNTDLEATLRWE